MPPGGPRSSLIIHVPVGHASEVMATEKDGDPGTVRLNRKCAGTGPFRLRALPPVEARMPEANPACFGGAPKTSRVPIRHLANGCLWGPAAWTWPRT